MPSPRHAASAACAALLAVGALAAPPSGAPPRSPPPQPPPFLTVAMGGSYWPLHDEVAGGGREGLEADLAADVARMLGKRVRFVGRKDTGVGSVEAVASGKADVALASITPTDDRRKLVDFTRPYLVLRYRFAGRPAGDSDALDPAGKRVAVPRGPALALARALFPRASAIEVASPDAAVQAVLAGKADLAFGEDVGLVLAIEGGPLTLVGGPVGESPIAIAVPKGQAGAYDAALAKLSGRIAELRDRYRPGETPDLPPDVYLTFAGGVDEVVVHVQREPLEVSLEKPEADVEWHSLGDGIVSISARARLVTPPAAVRRRADLEGGVWVKLADGTFIGYGAVTTDEQCGGSEQGPDGNMVDYSYDCPRHDYTFVAVRGDATARTTFTVSEGT